MEPIELTPEQMQQYIAVLNEVERYRNLSDEEKELLVRRIMAHTYMDLRCDWAFKHVFQNLELLQMLLDDLLPEDILSVEMHLPNEIDKMRADDKNVIMDVLVKTKDGDEIIVEMQRKNKKTFYNRMLYYGASMLHGQLKKRESYAKLRPVYVICFMDYLLPHESDQLVYRYCLRETTTGERYGNQLSILFCELPRLKKESIEGLNPLESWFYILKNIGKFAGKPEEMGPRFSTIAEASRMTDLPDSEKLQYFRGMVTEEEKLDIGQAYYEDGLRKGLEKAVRGMRRIGLEPDSIAKALDLSLEEVNAIE